MPLSRHPAVFLDRDGVLNRIGIREGRPVGPMTLADFALYDGVEAAVRRLKDAGYKIIVVTNQPELSRGHLPPEVLEAQHARLRAKVPLDAIYVCPHDDAAGCACRKPKPGMLLAAADAHAIDLARSFMIGDRWRDVGAGRAAGCRTYLIDRGYREDVVERPDHVVAGLPEAADHILGGGTQRA